MANETEQFSLLENLSRTAAKKNIRQQQAIKFIGKKIEAIGVAISSTRQITNELAHSNHQSAETVKKVINDQATLSHQFKDLMTLWSNITDAQELETGQLKIVNTAINKLQQERLDLYATVDTTFHAANHAAIDDVSKIKGRLISIDNQLHVLKTIDDLNDFNQKIMTLFKDAKQYCHSSAENEITIDKKIETLQSLTDIMNKAINHYDDQIAVLTDKVKKINHIIDMIDKHLSDLTPKDFDLTTDEILNMFHQVNQTDQLFDHSTDIKESKMLPDKEIHDLVPLVSKPVVSEESETKNIENVSEIKPSSITIKDTSKSNENDDEKEPSEESITTNKKHFWSRWKK